jgi:E1-E2 ATPase/Cation transporter/ATPase, N-terminus
MRVAANPSSARRRIGGQAQPAQLWVGAPAATLLNEVSRVPADTALNILVSDPRGLTDAEVDRRRKTYGPNAVVHERLLPWPMMLLRNLKNPFVFVLTVLGLVSYLTEDVKGTIVVAVMVALSVLMRFVQEFRSSRAAQVLRAMVSTTATVTRRHTVQDEAGAVISQKGEVRFDELVPGDLVHLSAGDMLPADVRLLSSKDLFVSQAALTGEALPVEKCEIPTTANKAADLSRSTDGNPLEEPKLAFMGTSVLGGSATAVVVTRSLPCTTAYTGLLQRREFGEDRGALCQIFDRRRGQPYVRMVHRRAAVADLDRAHDSHAENSLRPKRRDGASPALDDSGHRARHRSAVLTRGYGARDGASAAVVFRVVGHDPPQLLGTDPTDKDLVHPAVQVVALTRRV